MVSVTLTPIFPFSIRMTFDGNQPKGSATCCWVSPAASRVLRPDAPAHRCLPA